MMTLPLLSLNEIPKLIRPLQTDTIVLVIMSLPDYQLCKYDHYLTPFDYQVSSKYKFQSDRDRYLLTRGILQVLLRRYFGAAHSSFDLSIDPYGKPFIKGGNYSFNLSHSKDILVCAFSYLPYIGVDLEVSRTISNPLSLSTRFFNKADVNALEFSSNKNDAFLKIWTQKEAYVKAIGRGIAYGLDRFVVVDNDGSFTVQDPLQSCLHYGQYFSFSANHLSVVHPYKEVSLYQDFLNSV